jgi:O-methyltransferase involved in polyketide biosynthesis
MSDDLSVTALYTSATWSWAKFPNAHLVEHPSAKHVFSAVNAALAAASPFFGRPAPLRIALVHRHALIDALVREAKATRVLELAAGLSRRGVTMSADASIAYVEVDRPHVVETKRGLLSRHAEGRAALARDNWSLVGADVTTTPLQSIAPKGDTPLVVIAEGLFMYLTATEQRALARSIAALLAKSGGTLVFDLVPPSEQPRAGVVGGALEWAMKRFTGGATFARDERSRAQIAADLVSEGFTRVELLEPRAVARARGLPYPDVQTQQLVFVAHVDP